MTGSSTAMRAVMVAVVTGVWVFLWADVGAGTVVAGIAVGVLLVLLVDTPGRHAFTVRPVRALGFALSFFGRLALSSAAVAWKVLVPTSTVQEGIVRVVVPPVSPEVQIVITGAISLTPGTLVIEIVEHADATVFYVHCLDLDDAEAMRADLTAYAMRAIAAFAAHRADEGAP